MLRKILPFILIAAVLSIFFIWNGTFSDKVKENLTDENNLQDQGELVAQVHELSIDYLRARDYPGSEITIEQVLDPGSNYNRYVASYLSDGLKIYGLLTIPNSETPEGGYPAIIFNHGYIPPQQYRTTERYVAYVDGFSRNGFVVFKPDYRGHGNSEGGATGAYGSPGYVIDVINALSSIKQLKDPGGLSIVNPDKIGMWGHSLGGYITLRSMVTSEDIRAGVIWAGVVGSYPDLLNNWRRGNTSSPPLPSGARRWRQTLVEQYGSPEDNPAFWNSISANSYLSEISGPIQLHHGSGDTSVPVEFSEKLDIQMEEVGKSSELYIYPGDDHDISNNFSLAMQRSVEFFNNHLK